jgi:SAM-dependent methyltransferase
VKSDREWRYWGETDPLWAVAAWKGKRRDEGGAWHPEDFFALGASDMADVAQHWRAFGLVPDCCVEIGCGAGRMTAALLDLFHAVVGLEVSSGQLRTAQRLLTNHAHRVMFVNVDRPVVPLADASCTGMFSCHVFQHFSEYVGVEAYLRETFRVLRPGATACFHLPVPGAHWRSTPSPARQRLRNLRVTVGRLLGKRDVMEYHMYPAERVLRTLAAIGYDALELHVFEMRSNRDAHSYFLARRP